MLRFLATVCLVGCAIAFPDGAPSSACGVLTPNHFGSTSQTHSGQYTLVANGASGGDYTVTLRSTTGGTFRGFMIQAFDGNGQDVGTFTLSNEIDTKLICGSAGVTHSGFNNNLSSVEVSWRGPPGTAVQFKATVVERVDTFYENVLSNVVQA